MTLLCDPCYQGGTGLLPECEDGCSKNLDHCGLCLIVSGNQCCSWCGQPGRLHEVEPGTVNCDAMPTVGEESEGQWFLHWPSSRQGPFPDADAAWGYWHAAVTSVL